MQRSLKQCGLDMRTFKRLAKDALREKREARKVIELLEEKNVVRLVNREAETLLRIGALSLVQTAFNGKTIYSVAINDLIDEKFDRKAEKWAAAISTDLLWLRCEFARRHAWMRSVLEELLSARLSKKTLVTAAQPFTTFV